MFIRKLALVVATAAVSLLAVGIGSASATTLNTDPGNIPFPTGNVTVKNTSSTTALLTTGAGNISCTTTHFEATINNNHAATLPGTLNQLTFTSCTDTVPLLTVTSCHNHGTAPISVTTTNVNLTDVTVRCNLSGMAQGCYFTAPTASGTVNNAASTLTYAGVMANGVNPTGDSFFACPSSGTFSVVLHHIVQVGTNHTVTVV